MAKRTEEELVERQTPRGLVTLAKSYFKTAEIVVTSVGFDDIHGTLKRPGFLLPYYFLVGHSIELAMKAILLEDGHAHAKLRSYGHDLEKTWKLARPLLKEKAHRQIYDEFKPSIDALNILYREKELEYQVTGTSDFPRARTVLDAANEFWKIANAYIQMPSADA